MSTLSYSLTDLSPEHQPPHQHLRYVTSSAFGSDWNHVLHGIARTAVLTGKENALYCAWNR